MIYMNMFNNKTPMITAELGKCAPGSLEQLGAKV